MSGVKQYDRTELLDRAVEVFWRQGYTDTSTAELVEALGVNRKSMYAEFGSKLELFAAALERYNEHHLSVLMAPLETPDAGVDTIRRAFSAYGVIAGGDRWGRGCLLCNTAVERAALDPEIEPYVSAYLDRLTTAFRDALESGVSAGDLAASADLDSLAAYFTAAMIGVIACTRAKAQPAAIQAACAVATTVLDGLTPAPQEPRHSSM
ncbi:MAG: TetR/AcrR family transcriptional regulator [Actinomycetota bacterium]